MGLVFTVSKVFALMGCGWNAPSAIAFLAGELLESFRELRIKAPFQAF